MTQRIDLDVRSADYLFPVDDAGNCTKPDPKAVEYAMQALGTAPTSWEYTNSFENCGPGATTLIATAIAGDARVEFHLDD